jgi:Domain of unknown function (DUF4365)
MAKGKRRSEQHLIDERGVQLLVSKLPPHWVLHPYRPDYGIDFSLETFAAVKSSTGNRHVFETLGEHLFVQLKSIEETKSLPLTLYGRTNVEKAKEQLNREDPVGKLTTIRLQLEMEELVTVERMGVGVPMLLIVASLSDGCCYFVCLNDYVDKILIPRFDNYATKQSRTVHVPVLNRVDNSSAASAALRWYAKRAKLYAGFQRFAYQAAELKYAEDGEPFSSMARYFARRILAYDFWDDTDSWAILRHYGDAVRSYASTGHSVLPEPKVAARDHRATDGRRFASLMHRTDVLRLWDSLALLGRNYEDVCREWYLPTALGYLSSFSGHPHKENIAQRIGVVHQSEVG